MKCHSRTEERLYILQQMRFHYGIPTLPVPIVGVSQLSPIPPMGPLKLQERLNSSSRNKLTLCAMSAPSAPTKIRRAPSYCPPSHLNIPVKALTSSGLASIEWGPRGVS